MRGLVIELQRRDRHPVKGHAAGQYPGRLGAYRVGKRASQGMGQQTADRVTISRDQRVAKCLQVREHGQVLAKG